LPIWKWGKGDHKSAMMGSDAGFIRRNTLRYATLLRPTANLHRPQPPQPAAELAADDIGPFQGVEHLALIEIPRFAGSKVKDQASRLAARSSHTAEAVVPVPVLGRVPVPVRGAQVPGPDVEGAAPQHP
jgi:hypothetical protein